MKTVTYAAEAWKYFNGVFCVYKPTEVLSKYVKSTLKFNICRDLNEMEKRSPRDRILLKGSVCSRKPFEVQVGPNYADNELVTGPRYQFQDLRLMMVEPLGLNTSGVMVFAVNDGCYHAHSLRSSNFLRKYEVKGRFGCASSNFMSSGKIRERSTYSHIRQGSLEKLLSSIQMSHQALAFRNSGIDISSQEAYALASKGTVRPGNKSDPIIYGMRCTHFQLPEFTLEIQCIYEDETFLAELIHQIGVYLKSCAVCTQLRRTQFGHFTLEHALLRKHWTLEHVLNNVALCKALMGGDFSASSAHFDRKKMSDIRQTVEDMQSEAREDIL